nr:MAG TPA: hypothetical protein [Caudoviricetes sp.]
MPTGTTRPSGSTDARHKELIAFGLFWQGLKYKII